MTATGSAGAAADTPQREIVAHGRDLFRLPPDPYYATGCDGRRIHLKDPDFGEGLVARYVYRRGPSRADDLPNVEALHPDDARITKYLEGRDTQQPAFVRPDGPASQIAYGTERFVIRSHDDLTRHFTRFCDRPLNYGYYLSDIEYTRATEEEQLFGRPEQYVMPGVEPVDAGPYADIMPKGAIVTDLSSPSRYMPRHLQLPTGYGAGVGTIYEFEGAFRRSDDYKVRQLTESGFLVLYLDFDGRLETVVIDTQAATTADQLNARAVLVSDLDWFGVDENVLRRIAYFPAQNAGIADLRLPKKVRDELGRQVGRERERYYGSDLDQARKPPERDELAALLIANWDIRPDDSPGYGYGPDSTFGEIHDFACTRAGEVFTCRIGFTFLEDGKPKYNQSTFQFKRDPAERFVLKGYEEPIILIN